MSAREKRLDFIRESGLEGERWVFARKLNETGTLDVVS